MEGGNPPPLIGKTGAGYSGKQDTAERSFAYMYYLVNYNRAG
jgi:hypothetical protein